MPKQVTWFIAGAKEDGLRPGDVEQARRADAARWPQVYQAYEDQCQREGVVDFAELLLRTYELMRDNTALREHYQHRFRHILVDEFQDTNRLQYAWLKMFAGAPDRRCWRSATTTRASMRSAARRSATWPTFEREFRVEQVIKLERNYRSFGNILDSANELIAHNAKRLGKNLRTEAGLRRAGPRLRGDQRFRRSAMADRGGAATASRRHRAQRHRGAVPQQRAEPGDRERRCSMPAFRTRSTAGCASSSAPRSSMRCRTCG